MLRIRTGGLQILGRPVDAQLLEGLYVGPDGFQGWDDSTKGRRDSAERPASHGSFDVPLFRGERVVTVDGHALTSSEVLLGHWRSRVTGLGAEGGRVRVAVDHQGETLWADVRVEDARFRDSGVRGTLLHASFFMQFVAPDPRKYGRSNRPDPAASVQAFHYGNFPATPVLTVAGSAPGGYTVNGPGGRLYVVTRPLTTGQPHVIDMSTGWLLVGGVVQVGAVGRADTWAVPPGVRTVMSVSAGAVLTVDTVDTFI